MLLSIASAFFFTEIRDQAFKRGSSSHLIELLNKWQLAELILFSLFLQFVLVIFGTSKKYRGNTLVISMQWVADWIANIALSVLLKGETEEHSNEIILPWTPFLLLHLGGPDAISTYSSDNVLWKKYLLGLSIQVGVAIYVYVRFWTNFTLTYIVIPIFIAGIIKYGERIWILRSRSNQQVTKSVLSARDLPVQPASYWEPEPAETLEGYVDRKVVAPEGKYIHRAYLMFKVFTPLFLGVKLRFYLVLARTVFKQQLYMRSARHAFKQAEIELEFLHDVLYTKKSILGSMLGLTLRSICMFSAISPQIVFWAIADNRDYSKIDITVTYMLLAGAIFMEIYSVILHVLSNWTLLTLTVESKMVKFVRRTTVSWLVRSQTTKNKGIESMAQYSLMDNYVKVMTSRWTKIVRVIDTGDILAKFWWTSWEQVNPDLKNFIYSNLQQKSKRYENIDEVSGKEIDASYEAFDYELLLAILKERGEHVLKSYGIVEEFKWSITDLEFTHSLLLWHIATSLLFDDDHKRFSGSVLGSYCQISKRLSDFMMYLLLVRPNMLPMGISEVRIRETWKELLRFFNYETSLTNSEASSALLNTNHDLGLLYSQVMNPVKSKSVLLERCELPSKLQALVEESTWFLEEKWELIAKVWVEMLAFAACKCEWKEHAAQLRHGQELLTHVALLMAHLGLTEHIQIGSPPIDLGSLQWDWDQLSYLAYYLA